MFCFFIQSTKSVYHVLASSLPEAIDKVFYLLDSDEYLLSFEREIQSTLF